MTRSRLRDLGGADPYAVLGVEPTVDDDTIISAYRRLVREAHPDLPTGNEERTKLLGIARDILLDPVQRHEYDRMAAGEVTEPLDDDWPERSVWDDEDVMTGVMDSPITTPAPSQYSPPRQTPDYWHPAAAPYPSTYPTQPYRPPSSGLTLGIAALVVTFLCSPIGLVMGIVALGRKPPPSSADRVCAWIAVAWAGAGLLLCGGWIMLSALAGALGSYE